VLCGGVPARLIATLSALAAAAGVAITFKPPCDGSTTQPNLLDVIIAGGSITATVPGGVSLPVAFRATRPDLDLDGDGLEGFQLSPSRADCQTVVTACIDGNGTRIDGRDCFQNESIADGYSAAFNFTAIRAVLAPAP
jgi:hypothetical protein